MEQGRADGLDVILDDLTDRDTWPRCDAAGVFCAVLGIPQLIAAGRARVCCRSYIDDVGEDE